MESAKEIEDDSENFIVDQQLIEKVRLKWGEERNDLDFPKKAVFINQLMSRIKLFEFFLFANGQARDYNDRELPGIYDSAWVFHANWVIGKANKIQLMKQMDAWYI